MRASLVAILAASLVTPLGCQSRNVEGGELSPADCSDLVRHVQKLEAGDTGGLRDALNVGLRSGVEGCLRKGTRRAYQCVLMAEKTADLETCASLYQE